MTSINSLFFVWFYQEIWLLEHWTLLFFSFKLDSSAYWKSWHAASSTNEERSGIHKSEKIFGTLGALGLRRELLSAVSNILKILSELRAAKGLKITIILECCHAGGAVRSSNGSNTKQFYSSNSDRWCSRSDELSSLLLISESPLSVGQIASIEPALDAKVVKKSRVS